MMTKDDLQLVIQDNDITTLHLDDGKTVHGKIAQLYESMIYIEQLDQTGKKLNDVMIPLSKIAAMVFDLPSVKPDAPIDI